MPNKSFFETEEQKGSISIDIILCVPKNQRKIRCIFSLFDAYNRYFYTLKAINLNHEYRK